MTIRQPPPQPIGAFRAELGESPIWDDQQGELIWIDILRARLLRTTLSSGDTEMTDLAARPGSIALTTQGGLIAAAGREIVSVNSDGTLRPLTALPPDAAGRFNDGKPDAAGRFWVGTANAGGSPNCALYRFGPTGGPEPMLSGVRMSNGIGWSPDNRVMYYVDTAAGRLDAFDFDLSAGAIANRRTLLALRPGQLPDGLTVDADGRIWLAVWGGSCVLALTPSGALDQTIHLPTSRVASCAFGGKGYRTLFVTTAQEGATPDELAADPLAGALFAVDAGACGMAPHRFRTAP